MNYHAALAHFPKITYNRYKKLVGHFSNLQNLWQAELEEICRAGMEENIAYEFLLWREKTSVEKIMERLEKEQIKTTSLGESDYPKLLAEIADPPHTLFYRGKLPEDGKPSLGVVGTRKSSNYGKQMCEVLVGPLATHGLVIISGLALGIDGIAHKTALDAKGITIAVLGCGVNKQSVYPAAHKLLAEQIIANDGAVLSEYPPDFLPTQYSFPARNRIIAGLSHGTIVIEAPLQSGALITARLALDYNRDVMAVPHNATNLGGEGCNKLIKMGAKLVAKPEDALEAINLQNFLKTSPVQPNLLPANSTEEKIQNCLSREPKHIDLITKESNLDSPTVTSALTMMEIKGLVRNAGGMAYTTCV
ncbi:DNA-processing protein DprA [Patescibacteria group bacterium]|nr:DNA-processing protein DprA [Patescibacteria group bacterium]